MTKTELEAKLPWSEGNTYKRADIPEEWIDIVSRLDDNLRKIDPGYRLSQVKSKFGGLRYYAHPASGDSMVSEAFYESILQAEIEAAKTPFAF